MAKAKAQGKMIANNKKAYHDYFILDTYEAGIALAGTEVKSLRMGKCSIIESFIRIEDGEVFIYGMHISPYEKGNIFNKDPLRVRKLLLHKSEINKLIGKTKEKGMAIVPLKVYFSKSLVKVEIVLAKGKQLLASGVGQTSRVDALKQAIEKAKSFGFDLQGAVMASDAFFPFPDCVEIADKEGVTAVIQPGGSVKDQLTFDYCNEHGMAMVTTGIRHFKH